VYYARVDLQNHQRLLKAVEVCLQTGQPYSSLLTRRSRPRPFRVVNFALNRDREDLTERIRTRVDHMMTAGLLKEARSLYPYKDLNALKTVGYKELFDYLEHKYSLEEAIEKIKVNTRRYAKRQITWLKRDPDFQWFHPEATEDILKTFKSISD
jgi:tRNA dimethylallyltransferase